MKRLTATTIAVILVLAACTGYQRMSAQEKANRDEVLQYPTTFSVTQAEVAVAWGRAQAWIGQHSSMKMQVVTDFVIQTYTPRGINDFGFYLTKTPTTDGFTIDVQGLSYTGNLFYNGSKEAVYKAHLLAKFIKEGA